MSILSIARLLSIVLGFLLFVFAGGAGWTPTRWASPGRIVLFMIALGMVLPARRVVEEHARGR